MRNASATDTPASRALKSGREYQRGPENAATNESRYAARGATHRNGMTATSCVSWLVTASSRTEAVALSATQKNAGPRGGRAGGEALGPRAGPPASLVSRTARTADQPAKITNS